MPDKSITPNGGGVRIFRSVGFDAKLDGQALAVGVTYSSGFTTTMKVHAVRPKGYHYKSRLRSTQELAQQWAAGPVCRGSRPLGGNWSDGSVAWATSDTRCSETLLKILKTTVPWQHGDQNHSLTYWRQHPSPDSLGHFVGY
jgi:hypothetical protein